MTPAFSGPFTEAIGQENLICLTDLTGPGAVLVLSPHPDDESLACGAAIAAAVEAGVDVRIAIVTDGSRSHPNSLTHPFAVLADLRRQEVTAAVEELTFGRCSPIWLGYQDDAAPGQRSDLPGVRQRLGDLSGISAIWTTWQGDPHPDHQRTFRIAKWLAQDLDCMLWSCPVWGRVSTQDQVPTPVHRFESGPWRGRKARAIQAHASQMTGLISDDPDGFRMDARLIDHFLETDEIFIRS